jgi:hypothetical protein
LKEVLGTAIGKTVAAIFAIGAAIWGAITLVGNPPTVTWKIGEEGKGGTFIGVALAGQPARDLGGPCEKAGLGRWIGRTIFLEECIRIQYEPPELENVVTERLPYEETGTPFELLTHFVNDHHRGCFVLVQKGTVAEIREAASSQIVSIGDLRVCPSVRNR